MSCKFKYLKKYLFTSSYKTYVALNTWDSVKSASAAKVCRFFKGEYWVNIRINDGEPSKDIKSFICCTGQSSNKL